MQQMYNLFLTEVISTNYNYISHSSDFVLQIQDILIINKILDNEAKMLKDQMNLFQELNTKVIEIKEISKEDAKKEIYNLICKNGRIFYSEIADTLKIDIKTVVDICNELENEGLIKGDE